MSEQSSGSVRRQGRSAARVWSSLAALLLGLVVAAAMLEGALQAASYVMWRRARAAVFQDARTHDTERVVLCVGDSYTFGIGASSTDGAYPTQLEAALRARSVGSRGWSVVWPGRNSAEVVRRLPRQIDTAGADYVCVLVGANNAWNPSEMDLPVPDPEGGAGGSDAGERWEWKLRSARLVRLAATFLAGRPPAELRPDPPTPSVERGPDEGAKHVPVRARTPVADPLSDEERRVANLDGDAAKQVIDDVWSAYGELQEGDRKIFDEAVATSHQRIDQLRDPRVAAALVEVLTYCCRDQEAVDTGLQALVDCGFTAELYDDLVRPLARLGRLDEAWAMSGRALELRPHSARMHRTAAFLYAMEHREAAIDSLAHAFALDGNAGETATELRLALHRVPLDRKRYLTLLDGAQLEPDDRRAMVAIYDGLGASAARRQNRLRQDLLLMANLAASRGARLVYLTYPKPYWSSRANSTIATILDVAAATGAPLIDLGPVFAKLLESHRKDELYVPDGHLTDLGYRLMAEEMAARLVEIESRRHGGGTEPGASEGH